jgi:hypothetical protein
METIDSRVAKGAAAVLAAAAAFSRDQGITREMENIAAASARGYFLPDEDESVRLRYMQYLSMRAAMLETLSSLTAVSGQHRREWSERLPAFVTAFAAACMLMRAGRFISGLAEEHPVLWKKLDEDDLRLGLPRKTFTAIYKAGTSPTNLYRFYAATEYYNGQREMIHAWKDDAVLGPVIELLAEEEPWIERRRRDFWKRHFGYRMFSIRRRQRSAWRKVMFGLFEAAGTAIADLRQPGIKAADAPKRLTPSLRAALAPHLRPGDVFVTRHDDALSNLFLPGFWPHAALYLGTEEERTALGLDLIPEAGGAIRFLEAKKDGVCFRALDETLEVDACLVLRPQLSDLEMATALRQATSHAGKPYDFLFDFRGSDRLACTGVIYRGFHGIGSVNFRLKEVSGRLCLPAEDLIDQSLACGFLIHAACGLGDKGILFGAAAEDAFRGTRRAR